MKEGRKIGVVDYLAFACISIAGILPQYLLSSFASAYYTDVALVSAGAIGVVILIMRITDGISDLIMGRIIDRTNTKWGKARPWMFVGTIGLVISLFMIFHAPAAFSETGKIIYFAVCYFLLMVIFATMQGVAGSTMIVFITHDPQQRTKFGASGMAGTYVGGVIALTVTSILLTAWGYIQSGYDKTILLYAVILLFAGLFSVFRLREKQQVVVTNKSTGEIQRTSLKDVLRSMLKNRYYVFAVLVGLLINLTNGITTGLGVYFSRDVFGSASLFTYITIAVLFPTLIGLPIAVLMAKKLGNYKTLAYGRIGYMIFIAIAAIGLITTNFSLYIIGQIGGGFCAATFAACFTAVVANTCDYSEWKFRTNSSGLMMSATSFSNKVGLGLGSALTGLILVLAKYNGQAAADGIAQSAYTVSVERWAMVILPLLMNLLVTILLFANNVDKHMPVIARELEERRQQEA